MFYPIANESGRLVSPVLPPGYLDFAFYMESLRRYAESWTGILADFIRFYQDPFSAPASPIISGPLFPGLLQLFQFGPGTYLPLGLCYLALSCGLVAVWLWWLANNGLGRGWLVVFALFPNPVWFTLVVSPDLLFAALFAGFYLLYFKGRHTVPEMVGWIVLLVLALLTRPNGFALLLFVALHASWTLVVERRLELGRISLIVVLVIVFGLYLYPYWLVEMLKADEMLRYFGRTPEEFAAGILPGVPPWIDIPLSMVALLGAKLLYVTGLRPSYGTTPPELVIARAAAGVILLPGLLYMVFRGPGGVRGLVALCCLPFILGPSQDRYCLAISPILFLYGAKAYSAGWSLLVRLRVKSG